MTDRRQRIRGEGDVNPVALEPLLKLPAGELAGFLIDLLRERLAGLIGGFARGRALIGRQLGDIAQQIRQLGLSSQVADAELLELLGRVRARDRLLGLSSGLGDPIQGAHDCRIVSA